MHFTIFYKFHFMMVFLPPQLTKEWWKTKKYYNSLLSQYTSRKRKIKNEALGYRFNVTQKMRIEIRNLS